MGNNTNLALVLLLAGILAILAVTTQRGRDTLDVALGRKVVAK